MSLITAFNLSKSFGAEDIFSGIDLAVPPRARVGLVGVNGVGKTASLKDFFMLVNSVCHRRPVSNQHRCQHVFCANHEDRFIFEDSVLFYDRASSKIKTEEYLTGIPFDRKKGIQGGLAEAVVKNIRLTVGEANTKLRDFLKDEGESSFELHWNELNFMQTIETLKELGRFDETYYRYP